MVKYNEGKYVCNLSPELQERAKKELNEDPARREGDIEILRQWIVKQPHINGRTDDAFLLKFLRNAKFSIERAKEKIENYYTMRTAIPEWFSGLDVKEPKLNKLLKAGLLLPLGYDKNGSRVILARTGINDPAEFTVDDLIRLNNIFGEWVILDEQTQICGIVYIYDMTSASGAHLAPWTPMLFKKAVACWQDCYPLRPKEIHYWKIPSFFEATFAIVKLFLKEKLRRRISVHATLESLHHHFPPDILPKEYGGTNDDVKTIADRVTKEILELRPFFIDDEKYKVDESKRLGRPKTQEDLFGVDGTFRKLNID